MKQIVLGLTVALVFAGFATAQKPVKADSAAADGQNTSMGSQITAGTQVSGQLQNSLDVKKAKVGDQVLLKTTKAVKQNGQTVIAKGSTLAGRVTSVQQKANGSANSSIGVAFDTLRQSGREMPTNAMITSVLSAQTAASATSNDDIMSSTSSSTRSSSGASGGGLLGGATSTVGSVVSTTTDTVGGIANTTGNVVGSTTGSVASTVRGLSITQSTSASAQGGSTLNMNGGNLRLDKGTTFNLAVTSSTSASVDKN
ncbi:MAG: hypothetical protein ACKVRN_09180 [Pyrinomonadaceae bacterium]